MGGCDSQDCLVANRKWAGLQESLIATGKADSSVDRGEGTGIAKCIWYLVDRMIPQSRDSGNWWMCSITVPGN